MIDATNIQIQHIDLVLSQVCVGYKNDILRFTTSCLRKLCFFLIIIIGLFVEVEISSIMSKLLTAITSHFLNIWVFLQLLAMRGTILSCLFLIIWVIGRTILMPLLFPLFYPFANIWRILFHFLEELACNAFSSTFCEFIYFKLNSCCSRDACNSSSFISHKSLVSSMIMTMWSNLALNDLRTFSRFLTSIIYYMISFYW